MAGHPFGAPLLAMPPSTPPPAHPHQSPSTAATPRNAPSTPSEHAQLPLGQASVHSPFAPQNAMTDHHFQQQQHQHHLAAAATPSHQIPFNPTPVHHAPTQLTFGFASAPSTSSAARAFMQPTLPWGTPAASTSFGSAGFGSASSSQVRPAFGSALASPSASSSMTAASFATPAAASRKAESKRRRDDDDDDDLDRDSEMSSAVADPGAAEAGGSPSRSSRASPGTSSRAARQNLPKRIRAGLVWGGAPSPSSSSAMDESTASSPSATAWGSSKAGVSGTGAGGAAAAALKLSEDEGVDLGKLLATLDRPSLLLLVTRLLQSSPDSSLPLQMLSHLPSPSLQAVQAALDDAERGVRSVIPSNLQEVRPEYAWGRLKAPLLEFVSTVQRFMPFFAGRSANGQPQSSKLSSSSAVGASVGLGAREPPHPSTTFEFLAEVSARVLRLQTALPPVPRSILAFASAASSSGSGGGTVRPARHSSSSSSVSGGSEATRAYTSLLPSALLGPASPNALLSTLVPQLLDAWTELLTSVCRAVNDEGRMFGEETVKAWLATLEMLGTAGETQRKGGKMEGEKDKDGGQQQLRRDAESQRNQEHQDEAKETEAIRRIFDEIHSTVKREIGWLVAR